MRSLVRLLHFQTFASFSISHVPTHIISLDLQKNNISYRQKCHLLPFRGNLTGSSIAAPLSYGKAHPNGRYFTLNNFVKTYGATTFTMNSVEAGSPVVGVPVTETLYSLIAASLAAETWICTSRFITGLDENFGRVWMWCLCHQHLISSVTSCLKDSPLSTEMVTRLTSPCVISRVRRMGHQSWILRPCQHCRLQGRL